MNGPLVSIVLPTHNGSKFLRESIESCLAQSYSNWELIVVDDASDDDTWAIIQEFEKFDPRITGVKSVVSLRLPGALNKGFSLAGGSYLTWTSDDNRYKPTALAEMVSFLETHPDTHLVYADFSKIDESGDWLSLQSVRSAENLAIRNCVQGCFLYRRQVYEQIGNYNEALFLVEDWDYWIRVLKKFKITPLHRDLYDYRVHSGSLTATRKREVADAVEQLLVTHLPGSTCFGAHARARGYLKLRRLASGRRSSLTSIMYLLKALASSPGVVFRETAKSLRVAQIAHKALKEARSKATGF